MAVSSIKEITVETDGDTVMLMDALKNVNKEIRSSQAELYDVNKLTKMDHRCFPSKQLPSTQHKQNEY